VAYLRSTCTDSTTTDPVDAPFSTGDFATNITEKLNQLLAVVTVMGSYPGGTFGVASGLKLYTAYDAGTTYQPGEYASSGGVTYICILTTVGHAPPNGTYWTVTALAAVTALNVGVTNGVAVSFSSLEFAGDTLTLPDATSIVYVWLKLGAWNALSNSAGTLDFSTTITPPAMNSVLIGNCTTAAGVITPGTIDYSGVMGPNGNLWQRFTNDVAAPVDSPSTDTLFVTHTQAGSFLWVNSAYQAIGTATVSDTTGSTVTLTPASPSLVRITPSASLDVLLSNPPMPFTIWNGAAASTGYTITVKDYTGSYTYATIQPGYYADAIPVVGGGSPSLRYPPVIFPVDPTTSVSVIDSGGAAISAGTVTFNLTSGGGPIILAECVVGLPGAVVVQDYNGVGVTPVPLGTVTQGTLTVTLYYLLSNAPGTHAVVFTYTGGPNVYVMGVALDAPTTVALGTVGTANSASSASASVPLSSALGDLVVDAILSPGVLTSTQTSEATGTISGDHCAMSVALGNGATVTMGYGIAPASAYAMVAVNMVA